MKNARAISSDRKLEYNSGAANYRAKKTVGIIAAGKSRPVSGISDRFGATPPTISFSFPSHARPSPVSRGNQPRQASLYAAPAKQ